ncbi:hypothetical protein [Aquiflexum sp.]
MPANNALVEIWILAVLGVVCNYTKSCSMTYHKRAVSFNQAEAIQQLDF